MATPASKTVTGRARRRTEEISLPVEFKRLQRQNQVLRRAVAELRSLKEAAYHDAVTGLRNRRYFDERLAEELDRLSRHPDRSGSLILVDVDDFKAVNDGHGHVVGDQVLCEVAVMLAQTLRLEDVCCRFGGDEFVVILPETPAAQISHVVRRVQHALAVRNATASFEVHVSLGTASWPEDGCDAASLLAHADGDMYVRKRDGKRARTPIPGRPKLVLL